MWQSYWDDPWVLADWPLVRRRNLTGSDVRVHPSADGIAVRIPADGYASVLLAGDEAVEVLGDSVSRGVDRILVMGAPTPSVRARLLDLGYEERRTWDWYSLTEEIAAEDVGLEALEDTGEVQALLLASYPLADRRTTVGGRWWGIHRDGVLIAAGAADTWRGQRADGSVDWNSHVRSFTVHRDFRGEGIGAAAFRQMLAEEWRRTEWVQFSTWADAPDMSGLMRTLGLAPTTRVTNFRPVGHPSTPTGYPGAETA